MKQKQVGRHDVVKYGQSLRLYDKAESARALNLKGAKPSAKLKKFNKEKNHASYTRYLIYL